MVIDIIENYKIYSALGEKLAWGFEFIKKAISENLPVGKYEISGTDVYAMIQEYTTKSAKEAFFEGHKRYIDIQYVVSGTEEIGIIDISKAKIKNEYNSDMDAAFYEKNPKCGWLVLEEGDFAIFYPNDLHMPGLSFEDKASDVKKIVVKVSI